MTAISGFFKDTVLGPLRPPAQIQQWDRDATDPLGLRHWESGNYKTDAKLGLVGGFDAQLESGNVLNFGEIVTNDSGFLTDTVVFTFNFGEVNSHVDSFFDQMISASSVGLNFKAFNMKMWRGSVSAFTSASVPAPIFHFLQSSGWKQGFNVTPGGADTSVMPTSIPPSGNIFANQTDVFISGVYTDTSFSNFIYVRGQFPSGAFALGTYGGLGENTFTLKFSYDWTDINATTLVSDLLPCLSPPLPPISTAPPPESSLPSGMVSFWNLDENSPRIDKFGNTHVQSGTQAPSGRASGVSSNTSFATQFVRSSLQYLTASGISVDSSMNFGDEDFSAAAFVYLDSKPSGDMPIISKWKGPNDRQYKMSYDGVIDRFTFSVSSDGSTFNTVSGVTFGSPALATWYHVYGHHDTSGNQLGMSIDNGTLDTVAHASGANVTGDNDLEIGGAILSIGRSTFDGRIDAVGIWNKRLSSDERNLLIVGGSGLQFPFGLQTSVASDINTFWRMNEGSGLSRYDVIQGIKLTNVGGAADRIGLIGSGTNFERGKSQYLQASGDSRLAFADEDFTVAGWFNFNNLDPTSNITPMISKWQAAGDNLEYRLSFDSALNGFQFAVASGGSQNGIVTVTASGVAQSGQWHLVIGEHDSVNNRIRIKVDKDIAQSGDFFGGVHSGIAPFQIAGLPASGTFFDGGADSVATWGRKLTDAEFGRLFNE